MDANMRNLERLAATGDVVAVAKLEAAKARTTTRLQGVRFMKHFVTNGEAKARVSYSASKNHAPGYVYERGVTPTFINVVTLYAKSFDDGRALGRVLGDEYTNATDIMSDLFDEGHATIPEGHPLYAAALKRAEANAADDKKRRAAVASRRAAKRAEVLAPFRAESAAVAAFLRGTA